MAYFLGDWQASDHTRPARAPNRATPEGKSKIDSRVHPEGHTCPCGRCKGRDDVRHSLPRPQARVQAENQNSLCSQETEHRIKDMSGNNENQYRWPNWQSRPSSGRQSGRCYHRRTTSRPAARDISFQNPNCSHYYQDTQHTNLKPIPKRFQPCPAHHKGWPQPGNSPLAQ